MARTKFLGKHGRIYGPFTDADLSRMRESGEIAEFTYLWDETSKHWVNLEPPPPEPSLKESRHAEDAWEAIGLSRASSLMVCGTIRNVGPKGCDLVVAQTSESPPLSTMEGLCLNVLDPSENVAVNVEASVSSISREDHSWIFRLHWPEPPAL